MTVLDADRIDQSWRSWTGAHGGLVAGMLLDHAARQVPGSTVRALHVSFLSAVRAETVTIGTDVAKAGRTSATVLARLHADDRVATLATVTFGHDATGPDLPGPTPPAVPAVRDTDALALPADLVPFGQHLEIRPVGALPLTGGPDPVLTAWVRMTAPPDRPESALAVLLDALPPALYAVRTSPIPIPTVELAVHFTAAAPRFAPTGWTLARIGTEHAGGGWCVDTSEVWDEQGTLLATARQTRRALEQP